MNILRSLLGCDNKTEQFISKKMEEAHTVRNNITRDILLNREKIDKINRSTNKTLNEIATIDIRTITYRIAVATGGRKRGLK